MTHDSVYYKKTTYELEYQLEKLKNKLKIDLNH